jgi:superfamily II DNA or RNA helicase
MRGRAVQELRDRDERPIEAGAMVEARRTVWSVRAVRCRDRLALVHLVARSRQVPATRVLVTPFDRLTACAPRAAARVSRRAWMQALRALAGEACPFDVPGSAAGARVALLPFQLEPLLAMRLGIATRVLIADEVGLGKTVQAALVARDLFDRHPEATALIVAPASLREQWRDELRARTGLEATVADAGWVRTMEGTLPRGISAWRLARLVVVSIDFVKQVEILSEMRRVVWSLLVVDEVHAVAPGSDRFEAVSSLSARSERVVLLTATPHDGDEARYAALCRLGRLDGDRPLAVFRRTRRSLGPGMPLDLPPRRSGVSLRVRPAAAEARLHALLDRYVKRVWRDAPENVRPASRLAMSVLVKRAASSPWSLEQSLRRRRELITGDADLPAQRALEFGDGGQQPDGRDDADAAPDAVLGAAGLSPSHERTWLNLLINAASAASTGERKLAALERLLRRTGEPAIVFTEYRDTLSRLAHGLARRHALACLHGGLDADSRRRALEAFRSGAARVLLSTDAASQGLNLQQRCRLVVHVELPWNPLRIEQRNGRVDRIGQTRTVHAIQLVGRDSAEERIESRLADRRRRIDTALDRGPDEIGLLDLALFDSPPSTTGIERAAPCSAASGRAPAGDIAWPNLSAEAQRTASFLGWLRGLSPASVTSRPPDDGPARMHLGASAARRLGLGPGRLVVHRTRIRDVRGDVRETSLDVHHLRQLEGSSEADRRTVLVSQRVGARAEQRLDAIRGVADRADEGIDRRRRAIDRLELERRQPDQLDLFDEFAPLRSVPDPARPRPGVEGEATAGAWSADVDLVLIGELG